MQNGVFSTYFFTLERKGMKMATYYYQTNGEEMKCVNCGNHDFVRREPMNGGDGAFVPYECARCHFVSWFPAEIAPGDAPKGK